MSLRQNQEIQTVTLNDVYVIMKSLGEIRANMYIEHDEDSVKNLSNFLEKSATTETCKEFVKWMKDYDERSKKLKRHS